MQGQAGVPRGLAAPAVTRAAHHCQEMCCLPWSTGQAGTIPAPWWLQRARWHHITWPLCTTGTAQRQVALRKPGDTQSCAHGTAVLLLSRESWSCCVYSWWCHYPPGCSIGCRAGEAARFGGLRAAHGKCKSSIHKKLICSPSRRGRT